MIRLAITIAALSFGVWMIGQTSPMASIAWGIWIMVALGAVAIFDVTDDDTWHG